MQPHRVPQENNPPQTCREQPFPKKKGGYHPSSLSNLIVHLDKHHLRFNAVSPATPLCPVAVNATGLQLPNEREHLFLQARGCLEGAE